MVHRRATRASARQPHLPVLPPSARPPQDKKYRGEPTRLEIGDGNTIREYCTFNRGTAQDVGVTRLGNDNWIMAYVHVAHDCQVGNNTVFANCTPARRPRARRRLGDPRRLRGVHQFVQHRRARVHRHGHVVPQDVPPYVMAAGNPAQPFGINSEGLQAPRLRRGGDRGAQARLPDALRSGLALAEARAELERRRRAAPEVRRSLDFLAHQHARHHPVVAELLRVGMVAGEASGDLLAAQLIARAEGAPPRRSSSAASAGRAWSAQGFESHYPMEKLAVRGYVEVLKSYARSSASAAGSPADARRAARPLHRRRLARLQPRPRAAAQGRRHPDRPLREPVGLGLARLAHARRSRAR